jgi:peptidoglycan/xylan/chitin deacetylase (PgdA/CDA1 family)
MNFRRVVKKGVGAALESSFMLPLIRRSALHTDNVIFYHYVGDSTPHYQSFYAGCTLARFTRDLKCLSRVFDFASLNDVLALKPGAVTSGRPKLAVTFDDGFDLTGDRIMQTMHDHKVKATAFVVTSCIDNRGMMWRHMLSAIQALASEFVWRTHFNELALACGFPQAGARDNLLRATAGWDMTRKDEWTDALWRKCGLPPISEYLEERRPYFTWNGLEKWLTAGHSVGFHTHTHPFCSRLSHADLEAELIQPALDLRRRLNLNALDLSYPFGDPLQPDLERTLIEQKIFNRAFGIHGFSRKGTRQERRERAGAESGEIGWSVLGSALFAANFRS